MNLRPILRRAGNSGGAMMRPFAIFGAHTPPFETLVYDQLVEKLIKDKRAEYSPVVTIGKFVDGTPLYRMFDVLARANITVGRGTLANWIIRPAQLHYSRLYDALRKTLLSQPLIHGDEITVQVLKEAGKSAQSKSYIWVYRSAERCAEPVVFDYQLGRGQEYPQGLPRRLPGHADE